MLLCIHAAQKQLAGRRHWDLKKKLPNRNPSIYMQTRGARICALLCVHQNRIIHRIPTGTHMNMDDTPEILPRCPAAPPQAARCYMARGHISRTHLHKAPPKPSMGTASPHSGPHAHMQHRSRISWRCSSQQAGLWGRKAALPFWFEWPMCVLSGRCVSTVRVSSRRVCAAAGGMVAAVSYVHGTADAPEQDKMPPPAKRKDR